MKSAMQLAVCAGLISVAPAQAQELLFGVGQTQFFEDLSTDSALVSLEYRHKPFYERGRIDVAWSAVGIAHFSGDAFLGGGLSARYTFNTQWFVEASVMPGLFRENEEANDLGSAFEIRSLFAVGYAFKGGNRTSLAVSHKSNASTAQSNPGVNAVSLRWHHAF
ncbi:MAG: acyloxyacyl hydrolase [Paracoccaceae bacterium]